MRCEICQTLTIERLVKLAEAEFGWQTFPSSSFFKHHTSITALEHSANEGCDLCSLFVRGLSARSVQYYWDPVTHSSDGSSTTVLELARERVNQSDIKVCIGTQHIAYGESYDKVRMLDLLLLQVGNVEDDPYASEGDDVYDFEEGFAPLPMVRILLTTPRGRRSID